MERTTSTQQALTSQETRAVQSTFLLAKELIDIQRRVEMDNLDFENAVKPETWKALRSWLHEYKSLVPTLMTRSNKHKAEITNDMVGEFPWIFLRSGGDYYVSNTHGDCVLTVRSNELGLHYSDKYSRAISTKLRIPEDPFDENAELVFIKEATSERTETRTETSLLMADNEVTNAELGHISKDLKGMVISFGNLVCPRPHD